MGEKELKTINPKHQLVIRKLGDINKEYLNVILSTLEYLKKDKIISNSTYSAYKNIKKKIIKYKGVIFSEFDEAFLLKIPICLDKDIKKGEYNNLKHEINRLIESDNNFKNIQLINIVSRSVDTEKEIINTKTPLKKKRDLNYDKLIKDIVNIQPNMTKDLLYVSLTLDINLDEFDEFGTTNLSINNIDNFLKKVNNKLLVPSIRFELKPLIKKGKYKEAYDEISNSFEPILITDNLFKEIVSYKSVFLNKLKQKNESLCNKYIDFFNQIKSPIGPPLNLINITIKIGSIPLKVFEKSNFFLDIYTELVGLDDKIKLTCEISSEDITHHFVDWTIQKSKNFNLTKKRLY